MGRQYTYRTAARRVHRSERQWQLDAQRNGVEQPSPDDWLGSVPALQDLARYRELRDAFDALVDECLQAGRAV